MRRGLVLVSMLALLVLAPAPSAAASVGGQISAPTAVLYPECNQALINYSIQPTPDVWFWDVDVLIKAQDGTLQHGTRLNSNVDPSSGQITFMLCGWQAPGTWTITGAGKYWDAEGSHTWELAPSAFEVLRAATRTELVKKRLGPGYYALRVRVKDERSNGYFATDHPKVVLQQRWRHGKWRSFPDAGLSISDGRGSVKVSVDDRVKVRAVTRRRDNYEGSSSSPVVLRP